jgi:hypothetical protein
MTDANQIPITSLYIGAPMANYLDGRLKGEEYPTTNPTLRKIIDVYDDKLDDIIRCYRDIKYWFLYRISKRHQYYVIRPTTLHIGYHDQDTRILHSAMQCLVDYVDHEAATIDWTWDEGYQQIRNNMQEIYDYWTIHRPELKHQEDALCDLGQYQESTAIEMQIDNTDDEMLHKLIDIRRYLWS